MDVDLVLFIAFLAVAFAPPILGIIRKSVKLAVSAECVGVSIFISVLGIYLNSPLSLACYMVTVYCLVCAILAMWKVAPQ